MFCSTLIPILNRPYNLTWDQVKGTRGLYEMEGFEYNPILMPSFNCDTNGIFITLNPESYIYCDAFKASIAMNTEVINGKFRKFKGTVTLTEE